jgi:hypothetical protein
MYMFFEMTEKCQEILRATAPAKLIGLHKILAEVPCLFGQNDR